MVQNAVKYGVDLQSDAIKQTAIYAIWRDVERGRHAVEYEEYVAEVENDLDLTDDEKEELFARERDAQSIIAMGR